MPASKLLSSSEGWEMRPREAGLSDSPLARKGSDAETLEIYFSLNPPSCCR